MSDATISGLPAATSCTATDEFPANQSGTTRKVTQAQIVSALSQVVSALSANVASISLNVSALSTAVSAVSQQLSLQVSALSQVHSALSANVATLSLAVSALSTAVSAVSQQLSLQVSALSQVHSALSAAHDVLSNSVSVISAGLGGVQMRWVSVANAITGSAVTNISGLSISVAAGGTYQIEGHILYNMTVLTTHGFGLSYPTMAAAGFEWEAFISNAPTSILSITGYFLGYVMESAAAANSNAVHISIPAPGTSGITYRADVWGLANVSAAGTIQMVVKQAANAIAVLKGSFIRAFKII